MRKLSTGRLYSRVSVTCYRADSSLDRFVAVAQTRVQLSPFSTTTIRSDCAARFGHRLTLARKTTRPEARAKLQAPAHWQTSLCLGRMSPLSCWAHNGWTKQTITR